MKIKTETVWLIINIYINLFKVLSIHIIVYCSHYLKHCRQRVDLLLRSINKVLFWSIYGKNTRGNLLNLSHSQSRSAMNDKQSYFFALKIMKWKNSKSVVFFYLMSATKGEIFLLPATNGTYLHTLYSIGSN